MEIGFLFTLALIGFAVIFASKTIQIVPQQRVYVVERLGRYHGTLSAGLHFVIPFVDRIAYRHSMKEIVIDIPEQVCITNDNVQVNVDGILFFRIMDAQRASYGVSDYFMAITQLAQTTIRSEIGKIALDRSFEERENVNALVVAAIDKASDPWGVKVLRYEIKSINPPRDVLAAMEKQMRAERDRRAQIIDAEGSKRAAVLQAEGIQQSQITQAEGQKQSQILEAEGDAQARIRRAQGEAEAIRLVAEAVAGGKGDPTNYLIAMKYLETLKEMTSGQGNKVVYIPYEASGVLSSVGGIKEMLDMNRKG